MKLHTACILAGLLGIVQFVLWILQVTYVGNNYAAYIIGTTFVVISSLGLFGLIPQERTAQSEGVPKRRIYDSPRFWMVGLGASSCALAFWIANQIWTSVMYAEIYSTLYHGEGDNKIPMTAFLYGFNISAIAIAAAILALFFFGWRNAKYQAV